MVSWFEKSNRPSPAAADPSPLVVVGNGIASVRLCEEAVALGLNETRPVIVVGGEPHPA